MHDRNPYKTPLDFVALAKSYPPLAVHLIRSRSPVLVDFKSIEAQSSDVLRRLYCTGTLELNLVSLTGGYVQQLNYVLWIQDLLQASSRYISDVPDEIIGIDIGIGASAIYPLLFCKLEPNWKMIGTEIDDLSYSSALSNIDRNDLSSRVRVMKTRDGEPLLRPIFEDTETQFSFTMCNPPFYTGSEDVERSVEGKVFEPNSVCTGSDNEMIADGGEVAFIGQIVDESVSIGSRCRWFTSMLGKLSSVSSIVTKLRGHKVDNYAITELIQGQTRRWVVAWSFQDIRLPDSLTRKTSDSLRPYLPLPNELCQSYPGTSEDVQSFRDAVLNVLRGIEGVSYEQLDTSHAMDIESDDKPPPRPWEIRVSATRNSWSRAERRKKKALLPTDSLTSDTTTKPGVASVSVIETSPGLVCIIRDASNLDSGLAVECAWARGSERALLESFWSHVSRKVGHALGAKF